MNPTGLHAPAVNLQALDQRRGGGDVEHGLGDEGPGDLRTIVGRAATPAAGRRHVGLQAECIEDDDQVFEFGGERIEWRIQRGEKFGLASDPGSDVSLWRFGHAGTRLGQKTNQR